MKLKIISLLLGLLAVAVMVGCQKKEEAAEAADGKALLAAEQVKETIESYIQEHTTEAGAFALDDTVVGRTRSLTFSRIHETVNQTEDGGYYACVDFTEAPADTLDVDFYVSADESGTPEVTDVVIHKVNGVSRLTQQTTAKQ